jgi:mersacidin/lichenicidin family type 2 lantibiotic
MLVNPVDAWKNPAYRASLSAEAIANVPVNPAGSTWSALDQSQVRQIVGGVNGDANEQAESGGYYCTITTETCFCCIPE